jgi:hypothetical protein
MAPIIGMTSGGDKLRRKKRINQRLKLLVAWFGLESTLVWAALPLHRSARNWQFDLGHPGAAGIGVHAN